jgi:hypothetical protein
MCVRASGDAGTDRASDRAGGDGVGGDGGVGIEVDLKRLCGACYANTGALSVP